MDSTSEMRVFVRALDRGSFSRAAGDLELTPSAVSKLVSRLEDRLGVRLLQRSTRHLALTPEGEIYLARARRILADIDDTEAEVARARGAPRGLLRVDSTNAFGLHQLAPALHEFLARFPEIDVELSMTDRVIDLVEENIDVAIRCGCITDGALAVRKIAELEWVICAAPAYLARHGTPRAPSDLGKHECIVVSSGPIHKRWAFRTSGGVDLLQISPRVRVADAEAALQLAVDSAGIARLSDLIAGAAIRAGRLVPLLSDVHHVEPLPLSAVYVAGRHRLPKVRVFLDFLSERFGHAPWRGRPGVVAELQATAPTA
jgi:DNA-binding transcriptional LysR family regulator